MFKNFRDYGKTTFIHPTITFNFPRRRGEQRAVVGSIRIPTSTDAADIAVGSAHRGSEDHHPVAVNQMCKGLGNVQRRESDRLQ